jgi:hypothetical protein
VGPPGFNAARREIRGTGILGDAEIAAAQDVSVRTHRGRAAVTHDGHFGYSARQRSGRATGRPACRERPVAAGAGGRHRRPA